MKCLTYEQFEETYKPQKNPFVQDSSYDGCMFETYGVELAHVREQDIKNIWTLIDGENENWYIVPGYSIVNRFGYFICEIPWEDENIQVNDNEMCSVEDAIEHCIVFASKEFGIELNWNDVNKHFQKNLDVTFNNEMTTGRAKYIAMSYYEDSLNKESDEFEDTIHDYYSQL